MSPRSSVLGPRLIAIVFLAGCSFFSRSKNEYYTLDVITGPPVAVRGLPVAVGSVELPPGFDRREVVVRKSNQQLDVRNSELWSVTLQDVVLHTLAFDLAGRLPEGMVILPGEARPATPIRSIDIAFAELAAGPDRKVVLDARWVLHEPGRADTAHHEQLSVDLRSLDSAEVASGLSRALAELADRIAVILSREDGEESRNDKLDRRLLPRDSSLRSE